MFPEFADFLAGDRRGDGKRAAVIAAGIDAEFGKQFGGFGGEIEDGDSHCRVSNLIILRSGHRRNGRPERRLRTIFP